MKTLFEVRSSNEFSDCPSFFVMALTQEFVERVEALQAKCVDGVIRVASDSSDGTWESEFREETLRLFGGELVVDRHSFWFQSFPKHGSGHFETHAVSVSTLRAEFEKEREEGEIIYLNNEEYLSEIYQDFLEDVKIEEAVEE